MSFLKDFPLFVAETVSSEGLQCGQGNSLQETTREQGWSTEHRDSGKKKKSDQMKKLVRGG